MSNLMAELLYHIWLRFEKVVAWWLQHQKGSEVIIREVWIHKRETAQGYLGTALVYKGPPNRVLRILDLAMWYSVFGQLILWRTKKGDW